MYIYVLSAIRMKTAPLFCENHLTQIYGKIVGKFKLWRYEGSHYTKTIY